MGQLYDELVDIDARLKDVNKTINQLCRQNENCQRMLTIPGIGELTATAIVAAVPNPKEFRNGRHLSASAKAIIQWRQTGFAWYQQTW